MIGDPKKKAAPPRSALNEAIAAPSGARTLRKDFYSTAGSARFDSLMHSAYVDSIEQLTGRPSVYKYGWAPGDIAGNLDPTKTGVLGEYTNFATEKPRREIVADTVTLTPHLMERYPLGRAPHSAAMSGTSPEYALAHELAHRARLGNELREGPNAPGSLRRAMDSTYNAQEDSSVARQREMPNEYWTSNRNEHQAEAFANGVQFLRETAQQNPDLDVAKRVVPIAEKYERAVPGTRLMVHQLLQHPLYAKHPLYQAMLPRPVAADATAVATPTPRVP